MCTFQFVIEPDAKSVSLRLFEDTDHRICGEVVGPTAQEGSADHCIADAKTAYWAAIRIANTLDVEVVVLGDRNLWLEEWGTLVEPNGPELAMWHAEALPHTRRSNWAGGGAQA